MLNREAGPTLKIKEGIHFAEPFQRGEIERSFLSKGSKKGKERIFRGARAN